jgi:hypothetical protein
MGSRSVVRLLRTGKLHNPEGLLGMIHEFVSLELMDGGRSRVRDGKGLPFSVMTPQVGQRLTLNF